MGRRTAFQFQAQPGLIGTYMEWLAAAWGEPYGVDGDAVVHVTALFAATDRGLPRVRVRGHVLDVTIAVQSPIVERVVGTSLPSYLNALRPIFLEISSTVASVLTKAAASSKPPYAEHWASVAREIETFVKEHGARDDFGEFLSARHTLKAQDLRERLRAVPKATEMSEEAFWPIVESFRGSPGRARTQLAALNDQDLASFFVRLCHCLWELDRPSVARAVYGTASVPSGDDFVDARAAIVSEGRAAHLRALEGHVGDREARAEWLVHAAPRAIEKRGRQVPDSTWSIESGSNPAWRT